MIDETNQDKRPLHVKLPPVIRQKVKTMQDYFGYDQTTMVIYAINHLYGDKFRSQVAGYQAGIKAFERKGKKETREQTIERLKAMSDEELTAFIHSCGYITPEDEINNVGKFAVATTDLYSQDGKEVIGKERALIIKYDQGGVNVRMTLEQLIADLIKEKKI